MSMANKDKCFIITPIGDDTDPIRRHIEGIIDAALRPALEDKYDIEIAEEDAEKFKTIGDIVNYIEENK